MVTQLRHQWLKNMLADRGISQHDLAEMWEVTDGAVSKFLRSGEGITLTSKRVKLIANRLDLDRDDVDARFEEYLPPNAPAVPVMDTTGQIDAKPTIDLQATTALDNLTKAVETARKAFAPLGYTVVCEVKREL